MNDIDELLEDAIRAFKEGKEKLAAARERLEETVDLTAAQNNDPMSRDIAVLAETDAPEEGEPV